MSTVFPTFISVSLSVQGPLVSGVDGYEASLISGGDKNKAKQSLFVQRLQQEWFLYGV